MKCHEPLPKFSMIYSLKTSFYKKTLFFVFRQLALSSVKWLLLNEMFWLNLRSQCSDWCGLSEFNKLAFTTSKVTKVLTRIFNWLAGGFFPVYSELFLSTHDNAKFFTRKKKRLKFMATRKKIKHKRLNLKYKIKPYWSDFNFHFSTKNAMTRSPIKIAPNAAASDQRLSSCISLYSSTSLGFMNTHSFLYSIVVLPNLQWSCFRLNP